MKLSKHQQIAYDNPCFDAEDTRKPRYYWNREIMGVRLVVGLTANCGLE